MIIHFVQYQYTLATLLIKGEIDFAIWRFAAWNRPIVVCGKHHGIVVDASFDMSPAQRSRIAMGEFVAGCLLISAGIAKLEVALSTMGANGLHSDALVAVGVFGLGMLAAMDASIVAGHPWMSKAVQGEKDAANPS